MNGLEILGVLLALCAIALVVGFLVEAANRFGSVRPERYTEDELKALVRRHFKSAPVPDDSELRIALALLEGQS